MQVPNVSTLGEKIKENVARVIVGKEEVIDLLLVALFGSGHVLLEDVPGTGKTMLAKALAKSIDSDFHRIQFTPDLLPSDLSGINFFNQKTGEFQFRPGPLFTNVLLADEINRATPRTQSSLLECMEERQITIDGETRRLSLPFFVIATQNPIENQGTFPLPEAQLDRFLLKLNVGYPTHQEGLGVLRRFQSQAPLESIQSVASGEEVVEAAKACLEVYVADEVLDYLLNVVERTREQSSVLLGVSPRGSQALLRASQVYAALKGRDYVLPDDIKFLANPVLSHRMVVERSFGSNQGGPQAVISQVLRDIPVPAEAELMRG